MLVKELGRNTDSNIDMTCNNYCMNMEHCTNTGKLLFFHICCFLSPKDFYVITKHLSWQPHWDATVMILWIQTHCFRVKIMQELHFFLELCVWKIWPAEWMDILSYCLHKNQNKPSSSSMKRCSFLPTLWALLGHRHVRYGRYAVTHY